MSVSSHFFTTLSKMYKYADGLSMRRSFRFLRIYYPIAITLSSTRWFFLRPSAEVSAASLLRLPYPL